MRTVILLPAFVLAFALLQASATDAGTQRRHVRAYHPYGVAHRYRNDDTLAGYYEQRLDAVRFGSQRWWYIYDQQHGGRRR
jgi:hypothetical protein